MDTSSHCGGSASFRFWNFMVSICLSLIDGIFLISWIQQKNDVENVDMHVRLSDSRIHWHQVGSSWSENKIINGIFRRSAAFKFEFYICFLTECVRMCHQSQPNRNILSDSPRAMYVSADSNHVCETCNCQGRLPNSRLCMFHFDYRPISSWCFWIRLCFYRLCVNKSVEHMAGAAWKMHKSHSHRQHLINKLITCIEVT